MQYLIESTPLLYTGVFIFGLLIGSFLNVVILRLPALMEYDWRCQYLELLEQEQSNGPRPPSLVKGRSRCPNCGHLIRAHENIPLLSYVVLGGKCSSCKTKISYRYPLIEFITAVMFLAAIWHFGPTLQGLGAMALSAALIALTGIDADHQLLPDNLTLPLLWAGILVNLNGLFADLGSSVVGAIAGYLILWSIYQVFRLLTGKEGMGYGDFKLLAAVGAWLGWQMLPLIILLSSVVGATVGIVLLATGKLDREKPMPFGPFIAAAGWIAMIWGQQIMDHYTRTTFG